MLANLIAEIRDRRLWPIPAIALLVAIAAPLLFLKSTPPDAPLGSTPAPAAAPTGKLPSRAQRLLATSDITVEMTAPRKRTKASDPFEAPSSRKASAADDRSSKGAADAGTGTAPASGTTPSTPTIDQPMPVVITNPDGSQQTTTTPPIRGDAPATTTTAASAGAIVVDVRYGESIPARLHRAIPRLQTFEAGGRIIAIFVKYSPNRHKAVFAIAPGTIVEGDIECRRKQGVCRYVDIPVGKGVRLTIGATDGSLVTRRIDVERIVRASTTGATAAASGAPPNGACLLGKVLSLGVADAPLAGDACPS